MSLFGFRGTEHNRCWPRGGWAASGPSLRSALPAVTERKIPDGYRLRPTYRESSPQSQGARQYCKTRSATVRKTTSSESGQRKPRRRGSGIRAGVETRKGAEAVRRLWKRQSSRLMQSWRESLNGQSGRDCIRKSCWAAASVDWRVRCSIVVWSEAGRT